MHHFVAFTLESGGPVWVNPYQVFAITEAKSPSNTIICGTDNFRQVCVVGTIADVVARLHESMEARVGS